MYEGDGPVQGILTLIRDLVDVDGVIMRANSEVLLVWRIGHNFTPFSWLVESGDPFSPVIVVENSNISVVVADSQMTMLGGICQASCLLLNWHLTHG